jgi:hypothetical protein
MASRLCSSSVAGSWTRGVAPGPNRPTRITASPPTFSRAGLRFLPNPKKTSAVGPLPSASQCGGQCRWAEEGSFGTAPSRGNFPCFLEVEFDGERSFVVGSPHRHHPEAPAPRARTTSADHRSSTRNGIPATRYRRNSRLGSWKRRCSHSRPRRWSITGAR